MKLLFTLLLLTLLPVTAQADVQDAQKESQKKAQRAYYKDMGVLHRTSYALDYLLHPRNLIETCRAIYPQQLSNLPENDVEQAALYAEDLVKPVRMHIQKNEQKQTIALINRLYLQSKPEGGIDHDRFFAVYLEKAQKSREFIAQDLQGKTDEFYKFLKRGNVLTLDKCRNRMQTNDMNSLRSSWPYKTRILRSDLDTLLAKMPLPDAYRTAYRRLLE